MKILFEISKINKSSYYKWLKNAEKRKKKEQEEKEIVKAIKSLYEKHKGRLGIERMTKALEQEKNIKVNHKRVYKLMKENGYLSVVKVKKKIYKTRKAASKEKCFKKKF